METIKQKFDNCINVQSVSLIMNEMPNALVNLCAMAKISIDSISKGLDKTIISDSLKSCISDFTDNFQKEYPVEAFEVEAVLQSQFEDYILLDNNLSGNDF